MSIEEDEYAERIAEVQRTLINLLDADPFLGDAYAWMNDLWYEGPLAPLLQFFQDNRSEIEELA